MVAWRVAYHGVGENYGKPRRSDKSAERWPVGPSWAGRAAAYLTLLEARSRGNALYPSTLMISSLGADPCFIWQLR